jgi:phosphohistidine phosphatase
MKILTLLRHAKSSWDDPITRDFDRPLNARGRRAARLVGRTLRDEGFRFDAVYASPAERVVQTLADVAEGYGASLNAEFLHDLYLASPAVLLDRIHGADDAVESLLLVGHNPGLELLAAALVAHGDETVRQELELKYPTATVARIGFPAERWADVAESSGTLLRFMRPRDLDPELGPED